MNDVESRDFSPCDDWRGKLVARTPEALEHALTCSACKRYLEKIEKFDSLLASVRMHLPDLEPVTPLSYRKLSIKRVALAAGIMALLIVIPITAIKIGSYGPDTYQAEGGARPKIAKLPEAAPPPSSVDLLKENKTQGETNREIVHAKPGELAKITLKNGSMVALNGAGYIEILHADGNKILARHFEGELAGSVIHSDEASIPLVIEDPNVVRISVWGTIWKVRVTKGTFENVEVERGYVEVLSLATNQVRLVSAGRMLVIDSMTTVPRAPGSPSIEKFFFSNTLSENASTDKGTSGAQVHQQLNRVKKSHELMTEKTGLKLTPGEELDFWKIEIGKTGRTPEMLYKGGQIYRKLKDFSKAFALFTEAAKLGRGNAQEISLFLAIQLAEKNLKMPDKVIALCEDYKQSFPSRIFIQDVIMMQARAYVGQKKYAQAQVLLADYLSHYPSGSFTLSAHLHLARILVVVRNDCKAASLHLEKVFQMTQDGKPFEEAKELMSQCDLKPISNPSLGNHP